jgi:hypothetical protein
MTDPRSWSGASDAGVEAAEAADVREAERRRRRRLAEIFGDVLPDATRDERSGAWGERDGGRRDDEDFRREVPPHHG